MEYQEEVLNLEEIALQARTVLLQLLKVAKVSKGDLLVVGCSSSEVCGQKIGTASSGEVGRVIFESLHKVAKENGLYIAAQCCEHLNRALILEKEAAKAFGCPIVNVRPQKKAGGSFATAAFETLAEPVAVEHVKAALGIDIGDTLIGMHLQDVAVPVRTEQRTIGEAHVVCARTRPKFIGGGRAIYNEDLM